MTSRERVRKAINHQEPDCIPFDLGSTSGTSIHVSAYAKLRKALGLKDQRVKVIDPYLMLAEVEMEVIKKLGIDTVALWLPTTRFGFRNENWKPWKLFDGTEVMVPGKFTTEEDSEGNIYLYPEGDPSASASARMPKGGYYFDIITRQDPINKTDLDPEEWARQTWSIISEEDLKYLEETANILYKNTDLSIVGSFIDAGFGCISRVPGPHIKHPKGIRDPKDWYEAHILYPNYIKGIFELQCEIAVKNLELVYQAVGDKVDVVVTSGTDFGTQDGTFISPDMFREFYKPYYQRVNDWIHQNTPWKVFLHTDGSITTLLDDFVEAGVDILNPVQCSAKNMDPRMLKGKYGDKLVFWGGGVDTQKTLPFGSPDEVRKEVVERCHVFGKGGGYVFSAIHNIQPDVPIDNLIAMLRAFQESRLYK